MAGYLNAAHPNGSGDRGIAACRFKPGGTSGSCPQHPSWSADGRCIAFDDRPDLDASRVSIFKQCLDRSGSGWLIDDAWWPAYSHDGSKLAYIGHGDPGSPWTLFLADVAGSDRRALTGPSQDPLDWPVWSPDGKSIAFKRTSSPTSQEIVVTKTDGTGDEVVVARAVPWSSGTGPAWSPSGKLIALLRRSSIVVVPSDGGRERTVVTRVGRWGLCSTPVWRPPVALPRAKRLPCRLR